MPTLIKEKKMRCENCGKEMPEGASVCPECGCGLVQRPASEPQTGQNNPDSQKWNKDKLSIVLGVVSIAAFFAMPATRLASAFDLYFAGVAASLLTPVGPFAGAFGLSLALKEKKYRPGVVLNAIGLALYSSFILLVIYQLSTD